MRRRSLAAATAVVLTGAAALTGCSGGGTGGDADGSARMTLWQNATTGPGLQFWKDTVAGFEKKYPKVKIDLQTVQNEDLDGKLQTAMNSGDAPDIFLQRGGGKMKAMVDAGQLKDITADISAATKKVVPSASLKVDSIDGKIYAMPLSVLPSGVWYNKDLFDQAGIDAPPTTFDELLADAKTLKSKGIQPIALGAKDAWPAGHWYYNFAIRECSPDTIRSVAKSLSFTDPCWTKAGQDLQRLKDADVFNRGFLTTGAQQGAGSSAGLIANGKAAMEDMGAWDPGVIASLTPDKKPLKSLAWFPFPSIAGGKGAQDGILGGVDAYSCSTDAPPQCADFLNYLATTERQKAYYTGFTTPVVNSEAQSVIQAPLSDVAKAYSSASFVSQWLDTEYGQNVGNALNVGVVNLLAGKGDAAGIVKSVSDAAKKG